jgi:hypothetical protein
METRPSRFAWPVIPMLQRGPSHIDREDGGEAAGGAHSSGIPALRRPAKYVASYSARIFGTPLPCARKAHQAGDARKEISAVQPLGFDEFGGGAFGFPFECIGGGEAAAMERHSRRGAARFFEPDDRLIDVRLQQMHGSN